MAISFPIIELSCLYIFVGDYFLRVLLCLTVPPRIAGTNKGHRTKLDITDHSEDESDDDYDDEELDHSHRSGSPLVDRSEMMGGVSAINYDPRRFNVATDGIVGLDDGFDEPSKKLLTPVGRHPGAHGGEGRSNLFPERDLPADLKESMNGGNDCGNTVLTNPTSPTSNDSDSSGSSKGDPIPTGRDPVLSTRVPLSAAEEDRSTRNGTPTGGSENRSAGGSGKHSPRVQTPGARRKAARRAAAHGFYASVYQLYTYVKVRTPLSSVTTASSPFSLSNSIVTMVITLTSPPSLYSLSLYVYIRTLTTGL